MEHERRGVEQVKAEVDALADDALRLVPGDEAAVGPARDVRGRLPGPREAELERRR